MVPVKLAVEYFLDIFLDLCFSISKLVSSKPSCLQRRLLTKLGAYDLHKGKYFIKSYLEYSSVSFFFIFFTISEVEDILSNYLKNLKMYNSKNFSKFKVN